MYAERLSQFTDKRPWQMALAIRTRVHSRDDHPELKQISPELILNAILLEAMPSSTRKRTKSRMVLIVIHVLR